MRACNSQNYRAAWILTTAGANLAAEDQSGNSALSWAAVSGNAQIVQLLLSNGAPANAPNLVRQTPLLEAAIAGDHAIVKLLLGYGANPPQQSHIPPKSELIFDVELVSQSDEEKLIGHRQLFINGQTRSIMRRLVTKDLLP